MAAAHDGAESEFDYNSDSGGSDDSNTDSDVSRSHSSRSSVCSDGGDTELEEIVDPCIRPPEYYLSHTQLVNESEIVSVDYKDTTTAQLDRVEVTWNEYCSYVKKDPHSTMANLSIGDLHSFYSWKLDRRVAKDGRVLRRIKLTTSLGTHWKTFRLVYERVTGGKVNPQTSRQMHTVLRQLAQKHQLSHKKREKAPLDEVDARQLMVTNLITTKIAYKLGRYRIQNGVFCQAALFTANRPGALSWLQYSQIRVSLLRDPLGGPHRILLELTFEFTKTYLGAKDGLTSLGSNTFPIPEIIFDPSLILSPHVFLLGLIFADQAFQAPSLKHPHQLTKLSIPAGRNSLELPLKPEMDEVFLFRQAERSASGWQISMNTRLRSSTVNPQLKRVGQIMGLLLPAVPYGFRYGTGTRFDQSGQVSDSLRNLMMQHNDTRVFLKHYLSRRVTVDTAAIVRGFEPQDELMRAACRMSRWLDPNRPWKLTPAQSAGINNMSPVMELIDQRARMKAGKRSDVQLAALSRRIHNTKQRLRNELLSKIRAQWDGQQAVQTIEQQLAGTDFSQEVKTKLEESRDHRRPEHQQLITAVMSLPGRTLELEYQRRTAAIEAVMNYCQVQEEGPVSTQLVSRSRSVSMDNASSLVDQSKPTQQQRVQAATTATYHEKRPLHCYVCLGDEGLPVEKRVAKFFSPGDVSKHFKRRHLARIHEDEIVKCALCQAFLIGRMHVQNHALRIHGTVS